MSPLFHLDLSYNNFQGSIPLTLDNQNLKILDLSHNHLTGELTEQNSRLSLALINIDMSNNFITGSIPSEIGTLTNLRASDIFYNKLSGQIPSALCSCSSLEHLNLQNNFFHGTISTFLSSIKGLQTLDLSTNNFYGEIPKDPEKLLVLQYVNLSFNHLEGEVPLSGVFRNSSAFSIAKNSKMCGGIDQLKLPKCHGLKSKKHGFTLSFKVAVSVPISLFFVALFVVIYLWRKPKAKPLCESYTIDLRRVSYNELYKATEGISTANLFGIGSYGSVYKGILQQDEGLVAIKVLSLKERGAPKSFSRKCENLKELCHRNLLKTLTVCSSVDFIDDLDSSIKALNHLHNDPDTPIVHCDIKPSNILPSEGMIACIGDFGLAKVLPKSCSCFIGKETSSIAVRGTIGYIPPEYGMDVNVRIYSFRILLLEIFMGRRPTDLLFKDGLSLHDYCKEAIPHRVLEIIDMSLSHEATDNPFPTTTNQIKSRNASLHL